MKKVINGKMYDTETATLLGRVTRGEPRSWNFSEECLYRKKNGEYFFQFDGEVFSDSLAHIYPHNFGGERIVPTAEKYAMLWAEENFDGDEYVEYFGEVEE